MTIFKKIPVDHVRLSDSITSPLLIRIRPSCLLLALVLALHVSALIAITLAEMPFGLQFGCIVLLFFLAVTYCHQWRNTPRYRLQKNQNRQWVFYSDIDDSHFLLIEHCYYWSRWLVIFRVRNHQARHFFYPVLADSCDGASYRHLRVLSKFAF